MLHILAVCYIYGPMLHIRAYICYIYWLYVTYTGLCYIYGLYVTYTAVCYINGFCVKYTGNMLHIYGLHVTYTEAAYAYIIFTGCM